MVSRLQALLNHEGSRLRLCAIMFMYVASLSFTNDPVLCGVASNVETYVNWLCIDWLTYVCIQGSW